MNIYKYTYILKEQSVALFLQNSSEITVLFTQLEYYHKEKGNYFPYLLIS